jgi:hypothetical protein
MEEAGEYIFLTSTLLTGIFEVFAHIATRLLNHGTVLALADLFGVHT